MGKIRRDRKEQKRISKGCLALNLPLSHVAVVCRVEYIRVRKWVQLQTSHILGTWGGNRNFVVVASFKSHPEEEERRGRRRWKWKGKAMFQSSRINPES